MSERPVPGCRDTYRHFHQITSRWMDNDSYGHVNNVVYYSYFDTTVNAFLIRAGALDLKTSNVVGLVVETQCQYFSSVAFPDTIHVGLRVAKIGNSSVRYELGIFRNDEQTAAAQGHFIHVYVNRESNRPVPLPETYRRVLAALSME
jgi:acyl-CoA thioester hydrolase